MCVVEDLSLDLDGGGGYAGMSHSGTLLVLRNRSATACRIGPFASLSLRGAEVPFTAKFTARSPHHEAVIRIEWEACEKDLDVLLRQVE